MINLREQKIYCAEQIYVPQDLTKVLKKYSKSVIRNQPQDLLYYSMRYFQKLHTETAHDGAIHNDLSNSEIPKPESNQIEQEEALTEEEEFRKTLRAVFDRLDSDGSGVISIMELEKMTRQMGSNFTKTELMNFMQKHDMGDDRMLDFEEFVLMINKLSGK